VLGPSSNAACELRDRVSAGAGLQGSQWHPTGGINPRSMAGVFGSFSGTPVNPALGTSQEIFLAGPFL
jgi:hypothetical protein